MKILAFGGNNLAKLDYYKEQMEIDYLAYFSKSYFAFNCYVKDKYPKLTDDRMRINEVKKSNNLTEKFRILLLNDTFFYNLIDLRNALGSKEISNMGKEITFENVEIDTYNEKEILNNKYRKVHYYVKILQNGKIIFKCGKSEHITCSYDELCDKLKKTLRNEYQEKKIFSAVKQEFDNCIKNVSAIFNELEKNKVNLKDKKLGSQAEQVFKDNNIIVYKAFIEIIYLLRNALFHSEIDPTNNETKISYEKAYWLLRDFVKILS